MVVRRVEAGFTVDRAVKLVVELAAVVIATGALLGCAESQRVREVPGETLPPLPPTVTVHRRATTTSTLPPATYVVEEGDTLSRIASRLQVDLSLLVAYNGIADISRIEVGQVLGVPPPGWTVTPPTTTSSTVADPAATTTTSG